MCLSPPNYFVLLRTPHFTFCGWKSNGKVSRSNSFNRLTKLYRHPSTMSMLSIELNYLTRGDRQAFHYNARSKGGAARGHGWSALYILPRSPLCRSLQYKTCPFILTLLREPNGISEEGIPWGFRDIRADHVLSFGLLQNVGLSIISGSNINQIARSVNAGIATPKTASEAVFLLKKVYALMEKVTDS